jgi:hypothetical protein
MPKRSDLTAVCGLSTEQVRALCIQAALEVSTWSPRWTAMVRVKDIGASDMLLDVWDERGPPVLTAELSVTPGPQDTTAIAFGNVRFKPRHWLRGPQPGLQGYTRFLERFEAALRRADPAARIRTAAAEDHSWPSHS